MATSINTTLIALLLALKDLDTPLNENEQETFRNTAEQLQLDPDNWKKDYEPDLLTAIQANPSLNQLYRAAKSQLEALNSSIRLDLLPTQVELEQEIPRNQQPEKRGFAPLSDDYDKSNEINNIVINILANPNPSEAVKKLSRLEQLKQFLQSFSPK
ncbi:MAG: hypothetical protein KME57_09130 [Scytonema hyalinum WJT4-NPBG1]|jgi:hypothetical protein|nr:hypothetical protein [Scytonema hyalinum WJT4-NPBG1]